MKYFFLGFIHDEVSFGHGVKKTLKTRSQKHLLPDHRLHRWGLERGMPSSRVRISEGSLTVQRAKADRKGDTLVCFLT